MSLSINDFWKNRAQVRWTVLWSSRRSYASWSPYRNSSMESNRQLQTRFRPVNIWFELRTPLPSMLIKLVDDFQVSQSGLLRQTFGTHSIFVNRFVSLQDHLDTTAAG